MPPPLENDYNMVVCIPKATKVKKLKIHLETGTKSENFVQIGQTNNP